MIGAGTGGYANGLLRYLEFPATGGCTASTGDFGRSLFSLLAACAADPGLKNGGQGPLLLVAKGSTPEVGTVREASKAASMVGAGLRVCQYGDGAPHLDGLTAVPE